MLEHRCSKRLKTSIEAELIPQRGKSVKGIIRDIGRDGLFFETSQLLARHHIVKISFHLPDADNQYIQARGMIVHRTPQGVGLLTDQAIAKAFNSMQPRHKSQPAEIFDLLAS